MKFIVEKLSIESDSSPQEYQITYLVAGKHLDGIDYLVPGGMEVVTIQGMKDRVKLLKDIIDAIQSMPDGVRFDGLVFKSFRR
jgi:hypothetical protein